MFKNKVVIITGASKGIGLACAEYFWKAEAKVVCAVRNVDENTISDEMKESERVLLLKVDVRLESNIQHMVEEVVEKFGRIDILINNAGVDQPCRITDITLKHWNYIMETNVTGLVLATKYAARQMMKQKSGVIVNMSSIAGKEGFPAHSAYVASKHAVIGITKCVARDLIDFGIRVNAVCPGLIETDMLRGFFKEYAELIGADPKEELKKMIGSTPRGKMGQPGDVAELVGFLASDKAVNIIGQSINTDGGILHH